MALLFTSQGRSRLSTTSGVKAVSSVLVRVSSLTAGVAMLLAASACSVTSLNNGVFACKADSDCASGEKCLESICRSQSSLQGGAPESGSCTQSCAAQHQMCCGSSCVDLATDNANCGTCGHACATGENCYAGACTKETSCDDGLDNNGDGKIDCEDTLACPSQSACHAGGHCCDGACAFENTAELCSDGKDNDCNGKSDCEDSGCLGQSCGQGMICNQDQACAAGCFIDGQFYATGDSNADAPCLVCDPTKDTHDWSPAAMGAMVKQCSGVRACDDNGECRRATAQPCGGNGDCASKTCTAGLCL